MISRARATFESIHEAANPFIAFCLIPVVFSTCFVWSFLIFTVHTTTTNISFFLVPFIRLHLTMMMLATGMLVAGG